MSRSKRDILDTEKMLERLTDLLLHSCIGPQDFGYKQAECRTDAEALRRISMTLHRWHELECGGGEGISSWCLVRGSKASRKGMTKMGPHIAETFVYDDDGALKRRKTIMARYPALSSYVQGDPRGCALYILKPGDVPKGEDVSAYYSRGLAVHQ